MLRTQYASGRDKLSAPNITTTTGNIQGNNNIYYFWVKARNRVGYNNVSTVSSKVINNDSGIVLQSSNFNSFEHEDWRHIIVCINTTNNFSSSRVIYKQRLYDYDELTALPINSISITNDYIINGDYTVDSIELLPDTTNLLNGYRIYVSQTDSVYEFIKNTVNYEFTADNITSFQSVNGVWSLVPSNSLTEDSVTYRKELFEVNDNELEKGTIEDNLSNTSSIKYYIYNNSSLPISTGELALNDYSSDRSLLYKLDVRVLGYFNYNNNSIDISGINYVNTTVQYPDTAIQLNKPLPAYSALVIEVTPNILLENSIVDGTYISLYPKLNDYTTFSSLLSWADGVTDIATLKALPGSMYKDMQIRYVASKGLSYAFIASSTESDNGDTILIPNNAPTSGRWVATSTAILDNSITPNKLSESTLDLLTDNIKTTTISIVSGSNYTINLDTSNFDYFIINSPIEDGVTTYIDVTASLENNESKSIIIELRQQSGIVTFNNSLIFPGGNVPVLSGEGKTDLFVILINKDSSGNLKKRIFLVQKDV